MKASKMIEYSIFHLGDDNWGVEGEIKLLILDQGEGLNLEIDFYYDPKRCNAKDLALLKQYKTAKGRQKIFEELSYEATRFHEGVVFGLEYAYEVYVKETNMPRQVFLKVLHIGQRHLIAHDSMAYVATKALWHLLAFRPQRSPFLDKRKEKFVFPDTNKSIPIREVTKREIRKYLRQNDHIYKHTEEDYQELFDMIEKMQQSYDER